MRQARVWVAWSVRGEGSSQVFQSYGMGSVRLKGRKEGKRRCGTSNLSSALGDLVSVEEGGVGEGLQGLYEDS